MISKGYTSSMSESVTSPVIVPKWYMNILSETHPEKINVPSTIQIILENPDTQKMSDEEEDESSEEEEDDSQSDQGSSEEEDNEFSYIRSLIRGVPMLPEGMTTNKPRLKSAAVLIPTGYKDHDREEDLHIGATSFKLEDKNCSISQSALKTEKPCAGGSSEKHMYLGVPSSMATNTAVETEL